MEDLVRIGQRKQYTVIWLIGLRDHKNKKIASKLEVKLEI